LTPTVVKPPWPQQHRLQPQADQDRQRGAPAQHHADQAVEQQVNARRPDADVEQ
jgi:hypothetical protein